MVKNLAADLIDDPTFDNRDLAELVVSEHNPVGSIIKVEGEDDGVGYITALPISKHKERSSIQQILSYLKQRAEQAGVARAARGRRYLALTALVCCSISDC
jgi:hypothetical protein